MSKMILGCEVVCVSDVCRYLGLYATAARIKQAGVMPIHESKNAIYFRKCDLPQIASRIASQLDLISKSSALG